MVKKNGYGEQYTLTGKYTTGHNQVFSTLWAQQNVQKTWQVTSLTQRNTFLVHFLELILWMETSFKVQPLRCFKVQLLRCFKVQLRRRFKVNHCVVLSCIK